MLGACARFGYFGVGCGCSLIVTVTSIAGNVCQNVAHIQLVCVCVVGEWSIVKFCFCLTLTCDHHKNTPPIITCNNRLLILSSNRFLQLALIARIDTIAPTPAFSHIMSHTSPQKMHKNKSPLTRHTRRRGRFFLLRSL